MTTSTFTENRSTLALVEDPWQRTPLLSIGEDAKSIGQAAGKAAGWLLNTRGHRERAAVAAHQNRQALLNKFAGDPEAQAAVRQQRDPEVSAAVKNINGPGRFARAYQGLKSLAGGFANPGGAAQAPAQDPITPADIQRFQRSAPPRSAAPAAAPSAPAQPAPAAPTVSNTAAAPAAPSVRRPTLTPDQMSRAGGARPQPKVDVRGQSPEAQKAAFGKFMEKPVALLPPAAPTPAPTPAAPPQRPVPIADKGVIPPGQRVASMRREKALGTKSAETASAPEAATAIPRARAIPSPSAAPAPKPAAQPAPAAPVAKPVVAPAAKPAPAPVVSAPAKPPATAPAEPTVTKAAPTSNTPPPGFKVSPGGIFMPERSQTKRRVK